MNVATQPGPTTNGAAIIMSRARSWDPMYCCPEKLPATHMEVVMIIWMIMVMRPMVPLASETLRVAERLR